jgi:hypothetical protein
MTVLLPVQEMKQAQHNLPFLVGGKIYDWHPTFGQADMLAVQQSVCSVHILQLLIAEYAWQVIFRLLAQKRYVGHDPFLKFALAVQQHEVLAEIP